MESHQQAVGKLISEALGARPSRRSALEVTSDRIAEHIERYHDKLDGAERDKLSAARFILEDLATR